MPERDYRPQAAARPEPTTYTPPSAGQAQTQVESFAASRARATFLAGQRSMSGLLFDEAMDATQPSAPQPPGTPVDTSGTSVGHRPATTQGRRNLFERMFSAQNFSPVPLAGGRDPGTIGDVGRGFVGQIHTVATKPYGTQTAKNQAQAMGATAAGFLGATGHKPVGAELSPLEFFSEAVPPAAWLTASAQIDATMGAMRARPQLSGQIAKTFGVRPEQMTKVQRNLIATLGDVPRGGGADDILHYTAMLDQSIDDLTQAKANLQTQVAAFGKAGPQIDAANAAVRDAELENLRRAQAYLKYAETSAGYGSEQASAIRASIEGALFDSAEALALQKDILKRQVATRLPLGPAVSKNPVRDAAVMKLADLGGETAYRGDYKQAIAEFYGNSLEFGNKVPASSDKLRDAMSAARAALSNAEQAGDMVLASQISDDLARMMNLADEVLDYKAAPPVKRAIPGLPSEQEVTYAGTRQSPFAPGPGATAAAKGVRGTVGDFALRLNEFFADTTAGLRRLSKRGQATGELGDDAINLANEIITYPGAGRAGAERARRVIANISRIAGSDQNLDDINEILWLENAQSIVAHEPHHVFGKLGNLTPTQIAARLQALEQKVGTAVYKKLHDGAASVRNEYIVARRELLKEGIITQELHDWLAKEYPWYNPTRYVENFIEKGGTGTRNQWSSHITTGIKELKGGKESEVVLPIHQLPRNMVAHEKRLRQNRIANAIVENLRADKSPELILRKDLDAAKFGTNTIEVWNSGKRIVYEVPEWVKREYDFLDNAFAVGEPWLHRIFSLPQQVMRGGFTTYNPAFLPTNLIADSLDAGVARGVLPHQTASRIKDSLQRIVNDKSFQLYQLAGGMQGKFYGHFDTEEAFVKHITDRIIRNGGKVARTADDAKRFILDAVPGLGQVVEQAPRRAIFDRAMDKLMPNWRFLISSDDGLREVASSWQARQAAAEGLEATINFSRGGISTKFLNHYIPFINAATQGALKIPRSLGGGGGIAGAAPKGTAMRLAGLVAGQVALTEYNSRYSTYQDIPDDVRFGGIIIMLPGKKYDRSGREVPNYFSLVPRTREYAAFVAPTIWLMEQLRLEDPASLRELASTVLPALSPTGDHLPAPPIFEEFFEQWANKDFYTDRPIVPPELTGEEAANQFTAGTSPTFRGIGGGIGKSPLRLEHAFNSLFGGAGRTVTSITDAIAKEFIEPSATIGRGKELLEMYRDPKQTIDGQMINAALSLEQRQAIFKRSLSQAEDAALSEALREPKGGIPVVEPIERRFYPQRGGRQTGRELEEAGYATGTAGLNKKVRGELEKAKEEGERVLQERYAPSLGVGNYNQSSGIAKQFRDNVSDVQKQYFFQAEGAKKALGLGGKEQPRPTEPMDAAIYDYYKTFDSASQGGILDSDALEQLQREVEATWSEAQKKHVRNYVRTKFFGSQLVRDYYEGLWRLNDESWSDPQKWIERNMPQWRDTTLYAPHIKKRFIEWQSAKDRDAWMRQYLIDNPTYGDANKKELNRALAYYNDYRDLWLSSRPEIDRVRALFYGDAPQSSDVKAEIYAKAGANERLFVLTQPNGSRIPESTVINFLRHVPPITIEELASDQLKGDDHDAYILQARVIIARTARQQRRAS